MAMLRDTIFLLVFSLALAACAVPTIPLHEGGGDTGPTASIVLPEQLEVVTVNGLAIEGPRGMMGKGETVLEVSPGRYEVLAFYRELWERGDQHDVLRSDPAVFVVDAAPGGRYRLEYSRPGTLAQARVLAEDFSGWVEDVASGERTPSKDSGLQFRRGIVAAATFDDTLVAVAPASGTRQAVAPLPAPSANSTAQATTDGALAPTVGASAPAVVASAQQPVPLVVAPVVSPLDEMAPAAEPQSEEDWLALMKSWWSEASSEERRKFLQWVSERR